jgi:hypothetical protein
LPLPSTNDAPINPSDHRPTPAASSSAPVLGVGQGISSAFVSHNLIYPIRCPTIGVHLRVHQFWLNFVGSLVGWTALWFLLRRVFASIESPCSPSISWSDVSIFLAAFIGVTGFLPFTVVSLIYGLREIAAKIAGLGK